MLKEAARSRRLRGGMDRASGVAALLLGPLLFLGYHYVQAWATTGWRAQWAARLQGKGRTWARWGAARVRKRKE